MRAFFFSERASFENFFAKYTILECTFLKTKILTFSHHTDGMLPVDKALELADYYLDGLSNMDEDHFQNITQEYHYCLV